MPPSTTSPLDPQENLPTEPEESILSTQSPEPISTDNTPLQSDKPKPKRSILIYILGLLGGLIVLIIVYFVVLGLAASSYKAQLKKQTLNLTSLAAQTETTNLNSSSAQANLEALQNQLKVAQSKFNDIKTRRPKLSSLPLDQLNGSYSQARNIESIVIEYDVDAQEILNIINYEQSLNQAFTILSGVNSPTKTLTGVIDQLNQEAQDGTTISQTISLLEKTTPPLGLKDFNNQTIAVLNELAQDIHNLAVATQNNDSNGINQASQQLNSTSQQLANLKAGNFETNYIKLVEQTQLLENQINNYVR